MHVFFDVDYTLLGGYDLTLRPGTIEVITELREDGHNVYIWSGEGERWEFVRSHELDGLVDGVYGKPLHAYRRRLSEFNVPVVPDFVIDDYPGIVRCFSGVCIPEYLGAPRLGAAAGAGVGAREDRALHEVYDVIGVVHAGGTPDHPRYYPSEDVADAVPWRTVVEP